MTLASCWNAESGNDEKEMRPVKVFLLGGQSNMEGCGFVKNRAEEYSTHPENVVIWDATIKNWTTLE